jgi:hypothetical protein
MLIRPYRNSLYWLLERKVLMRPRKLNCPRMLCQVEDFLKDCWYPVLGVVCVFWPAWSSANRLVLSSREHYQSQCLRIQHANLWHQRSTPCRLLLSSHCAVFVLILHTYLDNHCVYSKKVANRPVHSRTASPMGQLLSVLVIG